MAKYKITEEQKKRVDEIRQLRESMRKMGAVITESTLDELHASTYRSAAQKGLERGDPKGSRIAVNAISQMLKTYAQTPLEFQGKNVSQQPSNPYFLNMEELAKKPLTTKPLDYFALWLKNQEGNAALLHINNSNGRISMDYGAGYVVVMMNAKTANTVANIYNMTAQSEGTQSKLNRQDIQQF